MISSLLEQAVKATPSIQDANYSACYFLFCNTSSEVCEWGQLRSKNKFRGVTFGLEILLLNNGNNCWEMFCSHFEGFTYNWNVICGTYYRFSVCHQLSLALMLCQKSTINLREPLERSANSGLHSSKYSRLNFRLPK